MTLTRHRLSLLILGLLCSLMIAGIVHAGPLDNGVYTADYTVLKAEDDSVSMANDYWEKPARITVKDGQAAIQLTLNHSKWVTEFKVPGGGGYVDTRIISTDEANDKRTVQFTAADISQPILSKIHVTVAEIDYDHDYTIRLVFKPESIQLIEAAEPAKKPDPPAETAPAAEQPASPAKPPAAAEQPAAGQAGGSKPQEPAAPVTSVAPPATTTGTVSQEKPAASAAPAEEPPAAAADPDTPDEEGAGTSAAAEQTDTVTAETAVTELPAEEAAASETDIAVQEDESPAAGAIGSSETEQSAIALSAAPAQAGDSSGSAKLWLFVGIAVTGAAILAAAGILIYRRRVAASEA